MMEIEKNALSLSSSSKIGEKAIWMIRGTGL